MYLEEIKSRHGGRTYVSVLIRESYREKGKVKHRTLCNLSKLPDTYIERIKKFFLSNEVPAFKEKIVVTNSREYGASYSVLKAAESVGLDKIVYCRKERWRQNIMALIAGRIVYQGSKLSLTNLSLDTSLWELCGHQEGKRPDVEKDCFLWIGYYSEKKPLKNLWRENT